jgi:hypothetical protein
LLQSQAKVEFTVFLSKYLTARNNLLCSDCLILMPEMHSSI